MRIFSDQHLVKCTMSQLSSAAASPDSLLAEDCEDVLASSLSDVQDPEGESFEKLFAKFAQMKGL